MFTEKEIMRFVWHDKVDDHMPWKHCTEQLKLHLGINITSQKLKKIFQKHFIETMGIEPYSTKCPICQSNLTIKQKYGYFIGCSSYPNCAFLASESRPFIKQPQKEKK